jgi:chromosome segregation ATPase
MQNDNDEKEQEERIQRMRMEQDEMILRSDVMKLKRSVEEFEMEFRVLAKKESDLHAEQEEAERRHKKAQEELRFKEEELGNLRKKIQTLGRE